MAGGLPQQLREQVSLCMIVRNEVRGLERCLRSVEGWVGECVVVDTGSSDGTPELARRLGARVDTFVWCDDFAAARNRSLELATRRWALVLDGDEWLEVRDRAALIAALQDPHRAGWLVTQANQLDGGGLSSVDVFRLFRRDLPAMRYRGQVHEQVAAVADGAVRTGALGSLVLHHDGYLTAQMEAKRKKARNLALAERLAADRPDDPYSWFVLGSSQDEGPERRALLNRALDGVTARGQWNEYYVKHLLLMLSGGLVRSGELDEAARVVQLGLERSGATPELLLVQGELEAERAQPAAAAAALEQARRVLAQRGPVKSDPLLLGRSIDRLLALQWLRLQDWASAEPALRRAAAGEPAGSNEPLEMTRLLGLLLAGQGRDAEALLFLERCFESGQGDASLARALHRALRQAGRHADGLFVLAVSIPAPEQPLAEAVESVLADGSVDAAAVLLDWYERDPSQPDACFWLGRVALASGMRDDAAALFGAALAARPEFARARQAIAALEQG